MKTISRILVVLGFGVVAGVLFVAYDAWHGWATLRRTIRFQIVDSNGDPVPRPRLVVDPGGSHHGGDRTGRFGLWIPPFPQRAEVAASGFRTKSAEVSWFADCRIALEPGIPLRFVLEELPPQARLQVDVRHPASPFLHRVGFRVTEPPPRKSRGTILDFSHDTLDVACLVHAPGRYELHWSLFRPGAPTHEGVLAIEVGTARKLARLHLQGPNLRVG